MLSNKLNKRGQVSETLTWIIATIIIIVVLLVFIYASIALGKTKGIDTKVDLKESSVDWINVKTNLAYSLNNANREKINGWISEEGENEE